MTGASTQSSEMGNDAPAFLSRWEADRWLPGYQQCTAYFMQTDDEGQVIATFVRKNPQTLLPDAQWRRFARTVLRRSPAAILYVHGWNDHFYRRHASEFWEKMGVHFYAVDLPKFGRSYRSGQTPSVAATAAGRPRDTPRTCMDTSLCWMRCVTSSSKNAVLA